MTNHDQNHNDDHDVEEFEYHCFDTCDRYPEGCKDCDQVMHEGYGPQDKKKPEEKK